LTARKPEVSTLSAENNSTDKSPDTSAHIKTGTAFWSAEEAFRLLVESIKDYALFMMDAEGNIMSWSLGVERILGYSEDEFLKMNGRDIFLPEDRAAGVPEAEIGKAIAEGRAEDDRWHIRKDKTRFWASGVTTALYDEAGALRGLAKVLRDFTDAHLLQQEREFLLERERAARLDAERARADAEAADRAKDEFIGMVSHELRAPLNVVMGWISLLLTSELDAETRTQAMVTIERNTQAQARLVNDLLDLTRIREGRVHLEMAVVDLVRLLQDVVEGARITAKAKDIRMELSVSSPAVRVEADHDRLFQVVSNLLSNAVKFTPEGGHIEVHLTSRDESAQIQICDSGVGISPELLPHVFDRFRQGRHKDGTYGGLGLGLSIVRHLVDMHGGTVRAASPGEGQGTTFTVELPHTRATSE
jgi:PAS domain S-box-containing protein